MKNLIIISILISLSLNLSVNAQKRKSNPSNPSHSTQQKALTNADVIRMTKAGLEDGVIIQAIQTNKTKFDISVNGLIQLKDSGVSQNVIKKMQKAITQETPTYDSSANQSLSKSTKDELSKSNFDSGEVNFIDGNNVQQMQRTIPKIAGGMSKKTFIPYAGTFLGSIKTYLVFNRNHAQTRTINTSPQFQITLPADVNPADLIVVVKLKTKSQSRKVQHSKAKLGSFSSGFREKDIISSSIITNRTKIISGKKHTSYTIKLVTPIKQGEYLLAIGASYYDFGIDKSK